MARLVPAKDLAEKDGVRFPNESDEYRRARDAGPLRKPDKGHLPRCAGEEASVPPAIR
jgi:hypothetical protein